MCWLHKSTELLTALCWAAVAFFSLKHLLLKNSGLVVGGKSKQRAWRYMSSESLCCKDTSVYVLQHAYSVPAIPSFILWFAHHPCSLLVFPLYIKIIFAVVTGISKHTSTSGFEKHCWSWLEIFLQWKQHFSVLTAEEPQIQILWDLSRLLEPNLIPQQQQLCFESPLAEELEGKLSVPNIPGSSPEGVVNFRIAVVSGKEQTLQDRQLYTKEQEGEHLPQLAQKVPTWSIPRAVGPTGTWWKSWCEGSCWRDAVTLLPPRHCCWAAFSATAVSAGLQGCTVMWPLEMNSFMWAIIYMSPSWVLLRLCSLAACLLLEA